MDGQQKRLGLRLRAIGMVVALSCSAGLGAAGCGSNTSDGQGEGSTTVNGTLEVILPPEVGVPWLDQVGADIGIDQFRALLESDHTKTCPGMPGEWGSLQKGRVTVRNESDDIIATSTTGEGLFSYKDGGEGTTAWCTIEFEVAEVPAADFYTIDIEGQVKDTVDRKTLESQDWQVELTKDS